MSKRSLIFLLSCLLQLLRTAVAQNNLPPVFEIKNDTANYTELNNNYWQILEDRQGKLTIAKITKGPFDNHFHYDSSKTKGVDNSLHTYWFRIHLKNKLQKGISISFLNEPYSEQFDLYIFRQGNKLLHQVNGVFIPYNQRDGFKELQAIPVLIQPEEEITVYKRMYRATQPYRINDHIWLGFILTDKLMNEFYSSFDDTTLYTILHSFTFGVLTLACLFNFFFYYTNREKVYFLFALFLLFEGLVIFELLYDFFLRDYPKMRAYLYPLQKFAAAFFLAHFVRYLLHTYQHFPKWDKLLVILSIVPGITTLTALFIEPFLSGKWSGFFWISTTLSIASLLFAILATLIFFKKENNRNIKIMLVAVFPALCLWTLNFGFVYVYGIIMDRYANLVIPRISAWLNKWNEVQDIIEAICLCWMAIFFSWILFLRYSRLRKEHAQQVLEKERLAKEKEIERSELIAKQKVELEKTVEERTAELKQSLQELKATQAQLIQSEKMASLGELTAGIAHEIQNPLNFVNNFSEVNTELIDEMKGELQSGNANEAITVANEIKENNIKINHHGKRADAIVKGMLQHSRSSTGQAEPININALADEYLRLSYHGLRAKDKNFNATIETHFDEGIGKIEVIPQDIGRVLLNLFNNAFYAVTEKRKQLDVSYEPTVSVSTKKENNGVKIIVHDNGNGISQKLSAKIFQPFFTTKPTGQGTGLGLSLSYDIIKAHGGEIKVESKEGEGSTFIITLNNT